MNTKNNTIFNFKMYVDALKRMRLPGLLYIALTIFITIIIPIGNYLSYISYDEGNISQTTVPILSTFIYMALAYVLCAPSLTLSAFSFLTKRNGSDYFHSFPQTRKCIFTVIMSAVLTWIIGIISACFVSAVIIYSILGKMFVLNIFALFQFLLCVLAASVLVCAACALSCTITGTSFTNFIVTGIILFMPRIMLTFVINTVTNSNVLLSSNEFLPLIDNRYNVVVSTFSCFLEGTYENFTNWSNIIYTFLLGILYIIIARLLYARRESESAGKASIGRKTQNLIRVFIAFPICLLPINFIYDLAINNESAELNPVTIFNCVIFYIVSILCMGIYELLSTQKIKNLKKICSSVIILGIVNVVIIISMTLLYKVEINYAPDANDVKYIQTGAFTNYDSYNYFEQQVCHHKITDPEIIKILTDTLKDNINDSQISDIINDNNRTRVSVQFKSGPILKTRNLLLSNKQLETLNILMEKNKKITEIYSTLPEFNPANMTIYSSWNTSQDEFNKNELRSIYNSLRAEIKTVDTNEWKTLTESRNEKYSMSTSFMLTLEINDINETTITDLPISTLTPKTFVLALNIQNKNTNDNSVTDIKNVLSDLLSAKKTGHELSNPPNCLSVYVTCNDTNGNSKNLITLDFYNDTELDYNQLAATEEADIEKAIQYIDYAATKTEIEYTETDVIQKNQYTVSYYLEYYDTCYYSSGEIIYFE